MKNLIKKYIFEIYIVVFLILGILELTEILTLQRGFLSLLGTTCFAWLFFRNGGTTKNKNISDVETFSPVNPLRGGGSTPRR